MRKPRSYPKLFSLMGLLLIFLVPYALAWIVYKHPFWLEQPNNLGTLLKPSVEFEQLKLLDKNGKPISTHALQHKWIMLYVQPKQCGQLCKNKLHQMDQIRLGTGKHAYRINRWLVSFIDDQTTTPEHISRAYTDQQALDMLHQSTKTAKLYIVDPHGHIILRYKENFNPEYVLKDFDKLLKVSQIG